MYCKNCGNLINQDEKFCSNCGEAVSETEQENVNSEVLNNESDVLSTAEKKETPVEVEAVNVLSENTNTESQITNQNLNQSISNNVVENNQPEQKNKKQKKSNAGIVIILLLLILIGCVAFYFISQKNNDDKKLDDNSEVTDKNDEDNENNDNKENEDKNDEKEDDDNQIVIEDNFILPDGYVLNANMKNMIENYDPITATKATLDMTSYNIIYEINMTNELIASCSDNSCETKVLDLNGEKAKYVGSVSNGIANSYNTKVLTEEGNIYDVYYDVWGDKSFKVEKISSTEKFVGFALIPFNYKDSSYEHITNGLGSKNSTAYGITEEENYISLDVPSQEPKPAIVYLDFAPDEGEEYFTTDLVQVYEDASLRYIDVLPTKQKYQECVSEKLKNYPDADYPTTEDSYECFSKIINVESYIVDGNNKKMHAQIVFIGQDNNLYFVAFDDKLYKLTKEKKGNNYIAKVYNNSKIKNIVTTGDYKESYGWFSSITLEYEDGKSETFENYNNGSRSSQIIYEKVN